MSHAPPARRRFTATPLAGTLAPMAISEDDGALMLRYGDGDLRAFEILYERHRGPLYRYLLRQSRDHETAADLFQDVWGRVISNRERYEVRARFTTYLFHIAHNCCIDHFRRQSARRAAVTDPVDDWHDQLVSPGHERPDADWKEDMLEETVGNPDVPARTPDPHAARMGFGAQSPGLGAEIPGR